ncbi:uncharacterized protein SPPG_02485 [Spizellomyces punctatus DAOM BR117]|uniref:Zinc finger PHD-type domain-containing protein n=1 Tax=Spizellomyces punctatus (strain DAOM BR117) TaxID=645134 RepID=A0A0L0HLP2_SPIPD|nr:uncharacterized protein SPPG_02485 [Spizellomyces punctatus DAOM BR117]KND01978.1 hypothetical protein SPPG_02485 [Spizellomyces punctatus DAOM BR117]|eukprot:XP_016610017.1 hypothetical protein SPPG_02485 [Spizellomyces punctatus DAOM BR117]
MLEMPTHPYHTLPFLPLEPPSNTDALVDEYTHHYSDSMFTAIVIPAGPLKSSSLPNPCLFPPNATAAVVEEAAEDIDIDPSDVIDRSDSFELNPLQEALQAGLGENLLSGLAADAEANLTAENNGVDDTITSGRIFGDLSDPVLFSPSPEPPESVPCKSEHLEILDCDSDLDDLTDGSAVIAGREDDDIESISDGVLEVDVEDEMIDIDGDDEPVKDCVVRQSHRPTIYEEFTQKGIDWCRYCGVTKAGQTAAFRPGPWGRRTLCNKHGCDYKGYGYADKQSRLDLTQFRGESLGERCRPVLQDFCIVCFQRTSPNGTVLVQCDGCPRAYHIECHGKIPDSVWADSNEITWYCGETCATNRKTTRIGLDLPKKNLPYMNCSGPLGRRQCSSPSPISESESCSSPISSTIDCSATKFERRDSGLELSWPVRRNSRDDVPLKSQSRRFHPYESRARR